MLEPDLTIALNTLKSDMVALGRYCEDWPGEFWQMVVTYLAGLMCSEPQVYSLLAFQNSMSSRCVF